jgi:hypothetical protein
MGLDSTRSCARTRTFGFYGASVRGLRSAVCAGAGLAPALFRPLPGASEPGTEGARGGGSGRAPPAIDGRGLNAVYATESPLLV